MKKVVLFALLFGAVSLAGGPRDTAGFDILVETLKQSFGRVGPNMFNPSHVGAFYVVMEWLECKNTQPSERHDDFKDAYCRCVVDARVANAGGVGKSINRKINPAQEKTCVEVGNGYAAK